MITQSVQSWKVIISLITRWLVGLLLILAAGLKLHAFLNYDISLISAILTGGAWLDVVTIYCEIILGALLLTGYHAWMVSCISCGFFSVLCMTSLFLAVNGQSSCGCFGVVKIHPWITFSMDLLLLGLLLLITRWEQTRHVPLSVMGRVLFQTCLIVGVIFLGFLAFFSDTLGTLARIRGELAYLSPSVTYAGSHGANEWHDVGMNMMNRSQSRIQGCL